MELGIKEGDEDILKEVATKLCELLGDRENHTDSPTHP